MKIYYRNKDIGRHSWNISFQFTIEFLPKSERKNKNMSFGQQIHGCGWKSCGVVRRGGVGVERCRKLILLSISRNFGKKLRYYQQQLLQFQQPKIELQSRTLSFLQSCFCSFCPGGD